MTNAAKSNSVDVRPDPEHYRCFAAMDHRGRWRAWRFGPATMEVQAPLADNAASAGQVMFTSVQSFATPGELTGMTYWRQVSQQYTGENALPHLAPLYFDVDADDDLDLALRWTRTLVGFFVEQLGLSESAVRVWFSGSKGAHILVDAKALGIKPSATLTADLKTVALELVQHLKAQTAQDLAIDPAVYSLPRMLRLPDQVNPKSGLFKVELYHHELFQLSTEQIINLARSPRGSLWTLEDLPDGPVPTAAQWFMAALTRTREPRQFRIKTAQVAGLKVRPDGYVVDELIDTSMPPCITEMVRANVSPGSRNRCELQIACWAKVAKLPANKALSLLTTWTQQNRPDLSSQNAQAKAASIIHSVYANTSYGFSCIAAQSAACSAGLVPPCDTCQAVRAHSLRQVFSLRVKHDQQWNSPSRISLEQARGLITRNIDSRVENAQADHSGDRTTRGRQNPCRPSGSGRPPNPGCLCGDHPSTSHASAEKPPGPGCHDALLATGTQR